MNFVDPQTSSASTAPDRIKLSRWLNFWVFGWVPGEMRLDAAAHCGGIEHVDSLETRLTFLQGLIAAFAGYVINVYSPYTGWVVCDDDPNKRPSS